MLAPNRDRATQAAHVAVIKSRVRKYTAGEMALFFSRRPPLEGTSAERQERLRRALDPVRLDKPISEYLALRHDA